MTRMLVLRLGALAILVAVVAALAFAIGARTVSASVSARQQAAEFNAVGSGVPTVGTTEGPPVITVIGDNMSAVSQAARPVKEWPLIVAPQLGVKIVSMSTASSGYTSKPLSWTYGGTFPDRAPHIPSDSRVVVIFGGANDTGSRSTRINDTAVNTVIAVRAAAPDAQIVIVGPVHTSTELPEDVVRVSATLRTVASAQKVRYVDPIAAKWVDGIRGAFRSDGVTPTAAGQEQIARKIEPVLQAALR